jgi:hypothetical protein
MQQTYQFFKRYISDGSFAEPPAGLIQKTGCFLIPRLLNPVLKGKVH